MIRGHLFAVALLILVTAAPSAAAADYWLKDGSGNARTWCSNPSLWNNVADAQFSRTTNLARSQWNAVPHGIFIYKGSSSSYSVYVGQYSEAFGDWALARLTVSGSGCIASGEIEYNTWWSHSLERAMKVSTHEVGHILNLAHVDVMDVMNQGNDPVSAGITHPTYNATMRTRALYPYSNTHYQSRSVSGDGTATPSTGFPTRLTATSGYGMGYDDIWKSSSYGAYMTMAWVTPADLHRFGSGFFTSTDPAAINDRIGIVEVDDDGIKAVVSSPSGGLNVHTLSAYPDTREYFLQVVLSQSGASGKYRSTMCAWTTSDHAFLGCKMFHENDMRHAILPTVLKPGLATWGSGTWNDYRPSQGWAKWG